MSGPGLASATPLTLSAGLTQPGAIDVYPPTLTGRYTVPIDHYRYLLPARTFSLRYAAYESFAAGKKEAPVLFYCGNEGALELFYNASGALFEHAHAIGAHVFFVEHRYYGDSLPLGNASFTPEGLQYLSVEQALADYASLIAELPKIIGCAGTGPRAAAARCDVILFGGSYGGMLAAWHRVKYPHLSVGAIASGAPIDFYPSADGSVEKAFGDAVHHTFATYGGRPACGDALTAALAAADAATNADLTAAGVRACAPFRADSAERFAFYARGALASIALADYPYPTGFIAPLPANPVQGACQALVGGGLNLAPLARLYSAVLGLVNASADMQCLDLTAELVGRSGDSWARPWGRRAGELGGSDLGVTSWNYQACTELLLEPLTSDGYGFYPESNAQIPQTRALCAERFRVQPRPYWMRSSFGVGADYAHASNIVFMENEKDPWHVGTRTVAPRGGVNGSVTRMLAKGGAHHQELRFSSKLDSPGVHEARAYERAQILAWLARP